MAKAETLEWLEYSKRDFDSATFLKNMKPLPCEIICYLCQQSAEKALKIEESEANIALLYAATIRDFVSGILAG